MHSVTKKAYAKINLHLDILSRYSDGYHEVSTLMQSVSLADDIQINILPQKGITVTCDKENIPSGENNIAYRAAQLFLNAVGKSEDIGISIIISKVIPSQAGLGGGSADAAAVLLGLNEMFAYPLDMTDLIELGTKIGADVPFCMVGGTVYADSKGDELHTFCDMPKCYLVITQAAEGVSTPWAYRALDEALSNFDGSIYQPRSIDPLTDAIRRQDICAVGKSLYNVFEGVISNRCPEVLVLKKTLLDCGAVGSLMSGSGTAVYGLFDRYEMAEKARSFIEDQGYTAFVATPIRSIC